jgi:hypothetical protein
MPSLRKQRHRWEAAMDETEQKITWTLCAYRL